MDLKIVNMEKQFLFVIILCVSGMGNSHLFLKWDPPNSAFDQTIYENALDPVKCQKDLQYILENDTTLLAETETSLTVCFLANNGKSTERILVRFVLDAGFRIPKGILMGNTMDMGNYHQCIAINRKLDDTDIAGKYCIIKIPLNQNFSANNYSTTYFDLKRLNIEESLKVRLERYETSRIVGSKALDGANFNIDDLRVEESHPLSNVNFQIALCLPKSCTTKEAINGLLFGIVDKGFQYEDSFCRLASDKPWVTGDTVAVILLSFIGLLTLLSTSYDIWHNIMLKRDPKTSNEVFLSFSAYTNSRNILTFKSSPNALHCLDGIRALSMIWIIFSHSFSSQAFLMNPIESIEWVTSYKSILIVAGTISVDTFFMLSGLLVVYTVAGKFSGSQLLKNLHFFYLNRLLRMFPILALSVLLDATLFNHVADGPFWEAVAGNANRCKSFWWTALLHIQNYTNCYSLCLGHSWYLSIDVQLHILSPFVLFWVLSKRRNVAWSALILAFLGSLTAATTYSFIKEFPSSTTMPTRQHEIMYYTVYYYTNTLTRAPPFIVGMVFGYWLHIWRGQDIKISLVLNVCLWLLSLTGLTVIIYSVYPTLQMDYDNQVADSCINSFMRPAWALGLGWIVVACVHGYGGPINWFLSLSVWKLPARLSFALYLLHYSLMVVINSTKLQPIYFTVEAIIFEFIGFFFLSLIVAFAATVLVDQPFTNLIKLLLDRVKLTKKTVLNTKDTTPTNIE